MLEENGDQIRIGLADEITIRQIDRPFWLVAGIVRNGDRFFSIGRFYLRKTTAWSLAHLQFISLNRHRFW